MSDDPSPRRRTRLRDLNWLGKSVYLGGAMVRLTASALDATANRVQAIASRSKEAFERELDPNIEEARVLEEYSPSDRD
ncbi:MAG: hypothetical protein ABEL97_00790 [Salinibacter sp.]